MRAVRLGLVVFAACGPAPEDEALQLAVESGRLVWLGDTRLGHDGQPVPAELVLSDRELEVYTETYPVGAASEVTLFWLDAERRQVRSAPFAIDAEHTGPYGNNTRWRSVIPGAELPPDREVEYWIRALDRAGGVHWDSRSGANHRLVPRRELRLFDAGGSCWQMAGRGGFDAIGAERVARPGDGLGLLWCNVVTPPDFELRLEWLLDRPDDNSGVVLRTPDPRTFGYDNEAWVGVHYGFEVQIDEIARPDGADVHRTGSIYGEVGQHYTRRSIQSGWNAFTIRVEGERYRVWLGGDEVTDYTFAGHPTRSRPSAPGAPRFIGLQSHTGRVAFRNVVLRAL